MKQLLSLSLLALASVTFGAVGDSLPAGALPKTVIQGAAIDAWEPDTTYLFECWATWCGPCLNAMPHLEQIWQTVKDEKIRIVGLNLRDRRSAAELKTFLETFRRGPITYPNLLVEGNDLPKRLGIVGIPYAFAVRNGKIVWDGHPMRLTVEDLRALQAGKSGEEVRLAAEKRKQKAQQEKMHKLPLYVRLERKADRAAAKGDWDAAAALQREAITEHPLAFRLKGKFDPSAAPESERVALPEATALSAAGDLAPYATLLGRDLPADDVFTIISYWRPNPFLKTYSGHNLRAFPGERERASFPYAHRVITLADTAHKALAEEQFASVPMLQPKVTYLPPFDATALFGFEDSQSSPYIALFKSGILIYKGSLDLMPEALKRDAKSSPNPSAEELKAAIAREQETNAALMTRFSAFRKLSGEAAEREMAAICEQVSIAAWETILLPYRFGEAYRTRNVASAKALMEALFKRYFNSEAALSSLSKLSQSWPELVAETAALQSRIAERLAEIHTQARSDYTVAYYEQAANFARDAGDKAREQELLRRAIWASPSVSRLRAILRKERPIPAGGE